jgi:tetratricopeptide (TPR) repeat protein
MIQRFKQALPETDWPWIIPALRQDPLIWNYIQNQETLDLLVEQPGENLVIWSPAYICLLTLDKPASLADLRTSSSALISYGLRHHAASIYEDLITSNGSMNQNNRSLENAALLALALRERKQLLGSWKQVMDELSTNDVRIWRTPFTCLYGMIDDPDELLNTLLSNIIFHSIVLHIILSNPQPTENQINKLYDCIKLLDLPDQINLLQNLSFQRPGIASNIAELLTSEFEEKTIQQMPDINYLQALIHRSEILRIGCQYDQQIKYLNTAEEIAANLLSQLAIRIAKSAILNNQPDIANEAFAHAIELSNNDEGTIAETYSAKIELGTLSQNDVANSPYDQIIDKGEFPQNLIIAAFTAHLKGDSDQAKAIACRASAELINSPPRRDQEKSLTDVQSLSTFLLEIGLYEEAIVVCEILLENQPNNIDGLITLVEAQTQAGKYSDAVNSAHSAMAIDPSSLNLRRILIKTQIAGREWQAALDELEIILKRLAAPKPEDLLGVATCALHLDQPEHAAQVCQQAIHLYPENGSVHALLGKALLHLGAPSTAIDHFEKAIHFAPHLPEPWIDKANYLVENDKIQEGTDTLLEAIKVLPQTPELHYSLGKIYLINENFSSSLSEFNKAYELVIIPNRKNNDLFPKVVLSLGKTFLTMDQIEDAHNVLSKANQMLPDNAEVAHIYAKSLILMEQPDKALSALEVKMKAQPADIETQLDYARAHNMLEKHPEEAIKVLTRILLEHPNHEEATALLAHATALKGDLGNALRLYQKALDTNIGKDASWRVYLCLGLSNVALKLDQPEIAIATIQEALEDNPKDLDLLMSLSEAFFEAGLENDAMLTILEAYHNAPDDPETLLWFAEQAIRLGAVGDAVNALERTSQLIQDQSDIIVRLGKAQICAGNLSDGIETFNRLLNFDNANLSDLYAVYLELKENNELSIGVSFLKRAHEISDQPDIVLLTELITAYYEIGDYTSALDIIDSNTETISNNAEILGFKADFLLKTNRPQAAYASIEHAIQINPEDPDLHYQAAQILRQNNDLIGALHHAEHILDLDDGHVKARYLAADLSYACLLDNQAREHLKPLGSITQQELVDKLNPEEQIELYCLMSELALDNKEEIIAAEIIAPFQEISANHPRLVSLLSRLMYRQGDFRRSIELLEEAEENLRNFKPSSELSNSIENTKLSFAEAANENMQWGKAISISENAIASTPFEPRPHKTLLKSLIDRAEYEQLCQHMDVKRHSPGRQALEESTFQLFQKSIDAALRCSQIDDTKNQILRFKKRGLDIFDPETSKLMDLSLYPQSPEEIASSISAKSRLCETDHAIRVAGKEADNPRVLLQSAIAFEESQPIKALENARKALRTNQDNPIYNYYVSRLAYQNSEAVTALENIKIALALWSDEPRWHVLAAKIRLEIGHIPAAITHLEQAAMLEPRHASHHTALGDVYIKDNDPDNAIKALESAIRLDPNEPSNWLSMSEAYQLDGNLEEAANCAEQAIKMTPRQVEPLLLRAKIELASNKPKKALNFIRAALKLNSKDPKTMLLLVNTLNELGRSDEAIEALDHAISVSMEPLPLLLERANYMRVLHGDRKRLEALKELAQRYPDESMVLKALSESLLDNELIEEAVLCAQHAVRVTTDQHKPFHQAELHLHLGYVLRIAGQLDQSIHNLAEAIRLAPQIVDTYIEIGRVHMERREYDKALEYFNQAICLSPKNPQAYFEAGQAHRECKEYEDAEEMMHQASCLAPSDAKIKRQLAAIVALNLVQQTKEASVAA